MLVPILFLRKMISLPPNLSNVFTLMLPREAAGCIIVWGPFQTPHPPHVYYSLKKMKSDMVVSLNPD
jgi:hypothetical protein